MSLEVVYDPAAKENGASGASDTLARLDIIFVHGLNPINKKNHASSTWSHKDGTFWPRDLLPQKIPYARVLVFDYNSNVAFDSSRASINDHADSLMDRYKAQRTDSSRPIVFVAHSLGGLVVKQALIRANANRDEFGNIKDHTFGLVFFGTPHRGGNGVPIGKIAASVVRSVNGSSGNEILRALEKDSVFSQESKDQFRSQLEDYKIITFFETKPMRVKKFGVGFGQIIVEKESATLGLATVREKQVGLDADHSNMCKYTESDRKFDVVSSYITNIAKEAIEWRTSKGDKVVQSQPDAFPIQELKEALPRKSTIPEKLKADCLWSLSFSNIDARKNNIAQAHQGTCEWLLATTQFRGWITRSQMSSSNGVLWIKGKPGAGKSTLMRHAFLKCQKEQADALVAGYFFNARGDILEKTPLGMMRSIVLQVVDRIPGSLDRFLIEYLDKVKKHGRDWSWTLGELQTFLQGEVVSMLPLPLFLFIDALDECDESQVREVVSFLENLSIAAIEHGTTLNVCLSSRHYPHIGMKKHLELVVEAVVQHDQDIVVYVKDKLRVSDGDIEKEVLRKAAGVFMWVVLVTEMLNKAFDQGRIKGLWKKLEEVPSDLDEVFSTLLEKDNHNKDETVLMLQWVLFAKHLLKAEQLYFAVLSGIDPEELQSWDPSQVTLQTINKYIIDTSRGLIEVRKGDNDTVQFIHESVNDFLLRNQRLQTLDPALKQHAVGASHDKLTVCCISYVLKIGELHSLDKDSTLGRDSLALAKSYPFSDYASRQMFHHSEQAQKGGVSQRDNLLKLVPRDKFRLLQDFYDIFTGEATTHRSYGESVNLLYALSLQPLPALFDGVVFELGIDVNARGGFYETAIQAASVMGTDSMVLRLIENGADLNILGGAFCTAITAASVFRSEFVVKFMLENGADVNLQPDGKDQSKGYTTALQGAAGRPDFNIVKLLLDNGANVNAEGGYYNNALQVAAKEGDEGIVKLLLERGANVNAKGGLHGSALQAAEKQKKPKIVELLLKHGAESEDSS